MLDLLFYKRSNSLEGFKVEMEVHLENELKQPILTMVVNIVKNVMK